MVVYLFYTGIQIMGRTDGTITIIVTFVITIITLTPIIISCRNREGFCSNRVATVVATV